MQTELCCYDLGPLCTGKSSKGCYQLHLTSELLSGANCFSYRSSHKPVPGTYREKVKESYKSHLEVPWQCSNCMPSAPPTPPHRQLKGGFTDVHVGSQVGERATGTAKVPDTICHTETA